MLIGRRHVTIGGVVTPSVAVAAVTTIVAAGSSDGNRITIVCCHRRCRSYGNDGRFPRLSTHLVMLRLVVIVQVSFPAIVSGIENNAAGIDTGCRANAAIHNYFLFVFHDDAFAGFLLDLHIHATIDDAIVIDSLHYFVHVASVVDVIVIVLSQTIRLIRPTFLYRVDGVADAEQFRVGAQRRFVCRYDAGFN